MWIEKRVSYYKNHFDNIGFPATYRQILFSFFGECFPVIYQLRKIEKEYYDKKINAVEYKQKKAILKSKLPGFAPAALLQQRTAGNVIEIERTGIMQLDFDYVDIQDYDIEELKHAVFSFPFIAFCGLSCSATGFFALALISEPEKLSEYAEHIFNVLLKYGIKADTSKGRNVNDLRYLSYDGNMLIRKNPEPLKISHFKTREAQKRVKQMNYLPWSFRGKDTMVSNGVEDLLNVQPGNRWQTVQKVAYTLGGLNELGAYNLIRQAIESNSAFNGEEEKYLKCADVCFKAGAQKPLKVNGS